jgi:hypothetical protein
MGSSNTTYPKLLSNSLWAQFTGRKRFIGHVMDGAAVSWCDGVLWNSSAPVCTLPFTPPRLRDLKPKLETCSMKKAKLKHSLLKLSIMGSYLCLVWKMSSCNFNDVDVPRLCGWEQAMEDDADWTLFNR